MPTFTPHSLRSSLSRRDWLKLSLSGVAGCSLSGLMPALAKAAAEQKTKPKACILLWMTGGPSQTDTFDMKPDHANGGPFKPIKTAASGIEISEHLPMLAKQMNEVALIRSMNTTEGDHARASYFLRTGYLPQGPIHYPTIGSVLGKEMNRPENELPAFVSILPYRFLSPAAYSSGFLGPKYAPLVVGGQAAFGQGYNENALQVDNLARPKQVKKQQAMSRLQLLNDLENDFQETHPDLATESHRDAYQRAVRMMSSESAQAFKLDKEPDELRDAYGRNYFGQGCLLARRLVERGVPFVEVSLNNSGNNQGLGWDTHTNNFRAVENLSNVLDPAWATLLSDLKQRGMLEDTLVVWMGEFGRTPNINGNTGRDHFPRAWTTALSGGGVKGGSVYGATEEDGMSVKDNPVSAQNFLATMCEALKLDPRKQNLSNVGRPIRLVDPEAKAIKELL